MADLTSALMIDLVPAALTVAHPDAAEHQAEIQRRWHRAAEHRTVNPPPADRAAVASAVENARCYLGVLTEIHTLWVLQEAGVRPELLYAEPEAVQRVVTVLEQESARAEGYNPVGLAARHMANWTKLALFHQPHALYDDQTRQAGHMHTVLLEQCAWVCSDALARLDGPWTLERALAVPGLGKQPYLFRDAASWEALPALDVALGRAGDTIIKADLDQARATIRAEVAAAAAAVAQPAATPEQRTPRRRHEVEFLVDALSMVALAGDHTLRIDGRPVASQLRGPVLAMHREAAAARTPSAVPTTTITVAGLRIDHTFDHTVAAVVVDIRTDQSVLRFPAHQLPSLLATLLKPRPDAVATVGRLAARFGDVPAPVISASVAAPQPARPSHRAPALIAPPGPVPRR